MFTASKTLQKFMPFPVQWTGYNQLILHLSVLLFHFIRYYIYGVQGFTDEIIFTAVFDFFALGTGWTLRGHSAVSTFFIYGTCSFMVERLYVLLYYKHGIKWYTNFKNAFWNFKARLYITPCTTWQLMKKPMKRGPINSNNCCA